MVFKFIDLKGRTHLVECNEIAFLGRGQIGQQHAHDLDGDLGLVCNYDFDDRQEHSYFCVYPPGRSRRVIAATIQGAWLMSDLGKTVENMSYMDQPSPSSHWETTAVEAESE